MQNVDPVIAGSDRFIEMMRQEENIEVVSTECSPFTEEFTPQHFHPEIGRRDLLKNIRQDLSEDIQIVVVTGDPGSGKSVIGRMLASESLAGNNVIYFDKTVVAFENVVKSVARDVGLEVTDFSRKGIAAAVEAIAERLETLPYRITFIFDGAERIYLATLERIRKMLDRVNTELVRMQVVFLGRDGLLGNLTQLSICNLKDVPEKRYGLQPLSQSETASYIEMCTGRLSPGDACRFDTSTVERIYHASKGNYRKIDQCAEEVLKVRNSDASGFLLFESVTACAAASEAGEKVRRTAFALSSYPGRLKLIAGGAVAAALAVGLIVTTGNKEHEGQATEPVDHRQAVEATATAMPESIIPEKVLGKTSPPDFIPNAEAGSFAVKEAAVEPIVAQTVEQQKPLKVAESEQADFDVEPHSGASKEGLAQLPADKKKVETQEADAELFSQQEGAPVVSADEAEKAIVRIEPQSTAKKNQDSAAEERKPVSLKKEPIKRIVAERGAQPEMQVEAGGTAAVDKVLQQPLEYIATEQKLLGGQESEIDQEQVASVLHAQKANAELVMDTAAEGHGIAAEPKKVVKPREATVARIDSEKAKTKKAPVVGTALVEQQEAATAGIAQPEPAAEDLYLNRLAAGQSWLNGDGDGKYTMQLMVLSDANARVNIERMLMSDGYRQEVDNLFILEGERNPAQVWVFYGEYESMEAARKARDAVSEVLKEHNPYVLSVRLAVQKLLNRDTFKG